MAVADNTVGATAGATAENPAGILLLGRNQTDRAVGNVTVRIYTNV